VSPASLGVPEPADYRYQHRQTQQQAHFAVIDAVGGQFGIHASADGGGRHIQTPWWGRSDVWASEAERQITDSGDVEIEMVRTVTQRVSMLRASGRGREIPAIELTLTAGGNVVQLSAWESGVTD